MTAADPKAQLAAETCRAIKAGDPAMSGADRQALEALTPAWTVSEDGLSLQRELHFPSYIAGLNALDQIAGLAMQINHHPDLHLGYKRLGITWTTHASGGLSRNDFIGAAKVDALFPAQP